MPPMRFAELVENSALLTQIDELPTSRCGPASVVLLFVP